MGVSIPGFAPTVFAVLCFIAAGIQLIGYYGVFKVRLFISSPQALLLNDRTITQESTTAYRRYTTLHLISVVAVFAYAAAFIAVSASKHSVASSHCISTFFPPQPRLVVLESYV